MNRKSNDTKPTPEGTDELEALFQEAQDAMDMADIGAAILEEAKRRLQADDEPADTPKAARGRS